MKLDLRYEGQRAEVGVVTVEPVPIARIKDHGKCVSTAGQSRNSVEHKGNLTDEGTSNGG